MQCQDVLTRCVALVKLYPEKGESLSRGTVDCCSTQVQQSKIPTYWQHYIDAWNIIIIMTIHTSLVRSTLSSIYYLPNLITGSVLKERRMKGETVMLPQYNFSAKKYKTSQPNNINFLLKKMDRWPYAFITWLIRIFMAFMFLQIHYWEQENQIKFCTWLEQILPDWNVTVWAYTRHRKRVKLKMCLP